MRSFALLVGAALALMGLATDGSARPQTTNPGGYLTVHVTVTNNGVRMIPSRAPRGQTAIFLLSNLATGSRVFTLGNNTARHRGTGFAVKLTRNQQKRILMYLDYRARLPASLQNAGKTKSVGAFLIT